MGVWEVYEGVAYIGPVNAHYRGCIWRRFGGSFWGVYTRSTKASMKFDTRYIAKSHQFALFDRLLSLI